MSDHLASQASLVYDPAHRLLLAVNAGSNSVSVFGVDGTRLSLRQAIPSGGDFPVSIALHGSLVYVLNAGADGRVQGYRIESGRLVGLRDGNRSLGLANANPPNFLTSPGQVGFTPDGRWLIVTTKASGSDIDVFGVAANGTLSAAPVVNASHTPVPFAFTFNPAGRLVVGEAGTSNVSTYVVNASGTLTPVATLTDGQAALCWIARDNANATYYVSNTASNTLSGYHINAAGQPSLVGATGVVATPGGGPTDLAIAQGGAFVYVELGTGGTVNGYRANPDGTLSPIGATPAQVGMEGLVVR
jgi:6-phosphogluconolactonase (cycloisomerase 2 family)